MAGDFPMDNASAASLSREAEKDGRWLELNPTQLLVVLCWTILADVTIFRAVGYAGPAVFVACACGLFLIRPLRTVDRSALGALGIVIGLLFCVAIRLAWSGTVLNLLSGVALFAGLGMTMSGQFPRVLEGFVFLARSAFDRLAPQSQRSSRHAFSEQSPSNSVSEITGSFSQGATINHASWLIPIAAVVVFGSIFVFANPDLMKMVGTWISSSWDFAWHWISGVSAWEVPFCVFAFLIGTGLLWPVLPVPKFGPDVSIVQTAQDRETKLYSAFRNTLLVLIALFTGYLCFEFATLWWREFPDGFYYAGYAHQGAAWLTFALALATGLLSLVFSGETLQDERLEVLRKLAWTWSGLNFILAIAVYNRLLIYVGYNGMTRMRTVGFFGITLVVIGFALVLFKIAKNRGFWWLIRAQLIALVLTVIAYGLFPVDWVAHHFNANQILKGQLHPSVMIAVKPMDDTAVPAMLKLVDVKDPTIREGVLAKLAECQARIESEQQDDAWHWTKFQFATNHLYSQLTANQSLWKRYLADTHGRRQAIYDFEDYAMQWY